MLRKPAYREYTTIHLEGLTNVGERARQRVSNKIKEVLEALIEMLKAHFISFEDPIFDEMKWIELKNWEATAENEINSITTVADRFEIPLSLTNFEIWEKLLKYKKQTFPNMCILVELILSLAGSNSAVEHGISMLTNILTNQHLKMSHSTLENLILIRCNDSIWLDYERNEIIQWAAGINLAKQRKLRVQNNKRKVTEQTKKKSNKRRKVTEDVESEDEEESDYTSTEEADFSFDED